jgi:hypothetical protein
MITPKIKECFKYEASNKDIKNGQHKTNKTTLRI